MLPHRISMGRYCLRLAFIGTVSAAIGPAGTALSAQVVSSANIARCESLLVSQQAARASGRRPFFLSLHARSGAVLTYFGVRHTSDPADTQFVSMQREFGALMPSVVFYEGTSTSTGATAADAVRNYEEPGLAHFLARAAGIPARSLEPARADEVAELLRQFAAEDLVMFYTLRLMVELRTRLGVSGPRLDSALARQLASVRRTPGLGNVLPDTAALRSAFTTKYPGIDMMTLPPDWFDPVLLPQRTPKSLFNAINYASSMFRDVYMYRLLASAALAPDARIFAEVGRDHIPAQAAALSCALDIPSGH